MGCSSEDCWWSFNSGFWKWLLGYSKFSLFDSCRENKVKSLVYVSEINSPGKVSHPKNYDKVNINFQTKKERDTALIVISRNRHLNIVNALLNQININIDLKDRRRNMAWICSCIWLYRIANLLRHKNALEIFMPKAFDYYL